MLTHDLAAAMGMPYIEKVRRETGDGRREIRPQSLWVEPC